MTVDAYELRCTECGFVSLVRADEHHEMTSLRRQAKARQVIHDGECSGSTSMVRTEVPERNPDPENTRYGSQGLAAGGFTEGGSGCR